MTAFRTQQPALRRYITQPTRLGTLDASRRVRPRPPLTPCPKRVRIRQSTRFTRTRPPSDARLIRIPSSGPAGPRDGDSAAAAAGPAQQPGPARRPSPYLANEYFPAPAALRAGNVHGRDRGAESYDAMNVRVPPGFPPSYSPAIYAVPMPPPSSPAPYMALYCPATSPRIRIHPSRPLVRTRGMASRRSGMRTLTLPPSRMYM